MAQSRPRRLLRFAPFDLLLIAALGGWTAAAAPAPGLVAAVVAAVLGLLGVLFAPGYALAAALFPRERDGGFTGLGSRAGDPGTVTAVERLVLAVGLSVCLVPLLGIGLNYAPSGVPRAVLLATVGYATVALSLIAVVRRAQVPPEERFNPRLLVPVAAAANRLGARAARGPTVRAESVLSALVVVGLVVAASGIGAAVIGGGDGERFTEFYLVTEDPETGEYVAGDYPDEIRQGSSGTVHVGITNQEGERTDYTVVVLLQRIDEGGVAEQRTLDRFPATVPAGETRRESHRITPELAGEDLRLTYLLYDGAPPDDERPAADNAYRSVHVWIDVPPADGDGTGDGTGDGGASEAGA